jgi:TolB-like protein/class 3 adenylate cyclase/Tfp pilus assembly protein PilF
VSDADTPIGGSTPSHHLAAVWFADLVGYSTLSEANEGEAFRAVGRFQAVVRAVVQTYGGRVVKFLGDGALAEFASTEEAVRSADALRADFARVAEAEGLGTRELRIGVHVGDVTTTEDGDLYGDGVNVASRIQAAADPGEVWVSEDVRRQLRQRPELCFATRGEHSLKGLRTPLQLHAVGIGESAPSEAPSRAKPRQIRSLRAMPFLVAGILIAIVALGVSTWFLGRGSDAAGSDTVLAILPFANLSGDEETEPFVLGVHDDLLTHLSRLGTFKVISRTTVMGYEGSEKSVPEIAKELGATTVLEGGIQRSGDRIRMNVQLIDARTDEHLWAERYDRTLTAGDVFAIQAEIAEQIAGALATALTPEQEADLARAPTEDLEALDLYYQGLEYNRRSGALSESSRLAVSTLAAAVEADPQFAAAWAALAQAHAWRLRTGAETDTTGARQALDRAVALAPKSRETLVAEGIYLYYAKADFDGANERFRAALIHWPNDADLMGWRSLVTRRLGRWKESIELSQRALALDPRNPEIMARFAEILDDVRRFDEAERRLDQSLVLMPSDVGLRIDRIRVVLEGVGDVARARELFDVSPDAFGPAAQAQLSGQISLYERDYEDGIAALEGKPIDPDDTADTRALLALLYHWAGRESATRLWADSLRRSTDRKIAELEAGFDPFMVRSNFFAFRGIAHALSGRPSEALQDGRRALDLMPLSRDAVDAPEVHLRVAVVFLLAGDRDAAFAVLDELAGVPGPLSSASLRLNPVYDSIRGDPRYAALLKKLEAAERSGTGTR